MEVFTNTAFPAFLVTKDQIFYATMHVAEAIAEVAVEEKREAKDRVFELRDAILRESGLIAREIDKVDQIEKETEKLAEELKRKKKEIAQLHTKLGF